jgi:hypothetical protein
LEADDPYKIKKILWFFQKGVMLTNDNLSKGNLSESKKCCFRDQNEQLTLFKCQHATTIWRVVNIATGLTPPKSINHMFGNWLTGIKKKDKSLIYVGIAALMWVI